MDLDAKLVESAGKIANTTNEYGDQVYGASTTSACLYRDQTSRVHGPNREEITADGILWFGASEQCHEGDIYNHETAGFLRIEKVIVAKTLVTDDVVKFIKCLVTKQRQVS